MYVSVTMSSLIPGALYRQGDTGKQIFLYLGKGKGICDYYGIQNKEGHIFLYVGREYEEDFKAKVTKETVMFRAKEMLSFRLGEVFSIVKRKAMDSRFDSEFCLSNEEIRKLYAFGNLKRI